MAFEILDFLVHFFAVFLVGVALWWAFITSLRIQDLHKKAFPEAYNDDDNEDTKSDEVKQ